MGDQPRCRASYRSQRYRSDWGSTEMQGRLKMMGDNANIKDAVDTVGTADVEDTADRKDTADTIDVADTVETVETVETRDLEQMDRELG